MVLAALRRVAQAKAASEAAKDESKSVTEVQKEEEVLPAASIGRSHDRVAERGPCTKVNHPSSQVSFSNVNFTSLMPGFPMCGPTPMPRARSSQYPAAKELEPWPSLVRCAFSN